MTRRKCAYRSFTAFLVFLALAVAGCGEGQGGVSGQVKFKGELLPSGRVTFVCQAGTKEVFSSEILKGRYTISGIPVGPVKILVETFQPAPATTLPTKIPGGIPPNIKGMPAPGAPPPAPGKYVPIPPRYGNVEQSGLSFTVTTGQQDHDIELQP
jgi:hypothetical protein